MDRKTLETSLEFISSLNLHPSLLPHLADVLDAARAHLSALPPPIKFIETWHVEYWSRQSRHPETQVRLSQTNAEYEADFRRADGQLCVRVTGPHQHEVPA